MSRLEWSGLGAGYRRVTVFRDWAGHADGGALTCLVGPNGSGKSTLLKTLAGVLRPEAGQMLLDGKSLMAMSGPLRARCVAIALTSGVPGGFSSVEDVIAMGRHPFTGWGGRLRRVDREAVERAIECAGVVDLLGRMVGTLSDGERQRVLIGRAIAQDTPVLLLDEPTAFLDLAHRVELLVRLRDLVRETGKVLIFSVHDLDLGLRYGERMLLIDRKGQLVMGTPEGLLRDGRIGAAFDTSRVALSVERRRFELREPRG